MAVMVVMMMVLMKTVVVAKVTVDQSSDVGEEENTSTDTPWALWPTNRRAGQSAVRGCRQTP